MGAATAAGAVLYIGTTAVVSATDTYTAVAEIVSIPKFGRTYNKIEHKPLGDRGTQKFKGSYNEGDPQIAFAKDISDAGQAAMLVALDTDDDYNFKILANDDVAPASAVVTMTAASPGVVSDTAHGLALNTPVKFVPIGSGVLPSNIFSTITYYVKTVPTADTYTISTTPGGPVINTTGSPTGSYTRSTVPAGSFQLFKAKVFSYEYGYENVDSMVGATTMLGIKAGTLNETARTPLT